MKAPDKKKARYYGRLLYYIRSCRDLTGGEKILLCTILDHIGKHEFGWPSLQTLATETGTTRQAVQRSVAGIKRRHFIVIEPGGTCKSNHYRAGPALLELERSWWAAQRTGAVKKHARILLRQAVRAALTGCTRRAYSTVRAALTGCTRRAYSTVRAALPKHIQGERIPANADNQTKKREGKGRISSLPSASALKARFIRPRVLLLPKKPRRGAEVKEALLPDKRAWVLDTIKQVLGKNFSAQGKNLKHNVKRLARWCRELADERGETKREVLKRLCREAQKAISNGSWKPPVFLSNLLKDALWQPLDPDMAPRTYGFVHHDGGNGDSLAAAFPGYAGIARRLDNRVQV